MQYVGEKCLMIVNCQTKEVERYLCIYIIVVTQILLFEKYH